MSNKADIPLDFACTSIIGAINESWRQRGRAALTDAIGRALGGGNGTMPLPPRRTTHDRYDRNANSRQQAHHQTASQDGATLDEMVTATGWLPHTTRAALTGLKKKGHQLTSEKTDGVRRYRIESSNA